MQPVAVAVGEDGADGPVVAEAVGGGDHQHLCVRVGGQRRHLRRLEPLGGEVELVGAQGDLGDPGQLAVRGGRERHGDAEFGEVVVDRGEALKEVAAGGLDPVEPGAGAVLGGQLAGVEPAVAQQLVDVQRRFRVQLQHGDAGQLPGDQAAFVGAVVGEDKAVGAEVEHARQFGEIVVLGTPVGVDAHEVAFAQRHIRLFGEDLADEFGVVLGDGGHQYALRAELPHHPLEGAERLAPVAAGDLDAVRAVVAEDAAPQGLVHVQDEHLLGTAGEVAGQVSGLAGVSGEQFDGQMRLGVDAHPGFGDGQPVGHQRVQVEDDQRRVVRAQPQQSGVELPPDHAEFGARAVVDGSRGVRAGQRHGVEDEGAAGGAGEAFGQPAEQPQFRLDGLAYVVGRPDGGDLVEDDGVVQDAQHEIGVGGVEVAAGV